MKTDNESKAVFEAAIRAWNAGAALRKRRERMKAYTYGRQWDDECILPDGRHGTEADLARLAGRNPLTNNLLRQMVKSVVGRFRSMRAQENKQQGGGDMALGEARRRNQLDELDARMLEEFLMSGCAVQRVVNERRPGGAGVWVDNVSPGRFFVNPFSDPRGGDIELIGMAHDMSLNEVKMRFGGGSESRCADIAALYGRAAEPGFFDEGRASLLWPADPSRCRVIEVWTMETRTVLKCHDRAQNRTFLVDADGGGRELARCNRERVRRGTGGIVSRRAMTVRWRGRWFAPDGTLLYAEDSPWAHGMHPFAVKFYPLIDGEVHPFVEDIVDQQRHINRLITLIDHIISTSAKGALLLPLQAQVPGISLDEYAAAWARPGAVIPYDTTRTAALPQAVTGRGDDAGATSLLNIEMRLMEQISGVSTALQGIDSSGVRGSATLYSALVENSVVALRDIYDTFAAFCAGRDRMLRSIHNS